MDKGGESQEHLGVVRTPGDAGQRSDRRKRHVTGGLADEAEQPDRVACVMQIHCNDRLVDDERRGKLVCRLRDDLGGLRVRVTRVDRDDSAARCALVGAEQQQIPRRLDERVRRPESGKQSGWRQVRVPIEQIHLAAIAGALKCRDDDPSVVVAHFDTEHRLAFCRFVEHETVRTLRIAEPVIPERVEVVLVPAGTVPGSGNRV